MKLWEYDVEIGKFEELKEMIERLNERGKDGWEAVGIAGDAKADNFTVLLKREPRAKLQTWRGRS